MFSAKSFRWIRVNHHASILHSFRRYPCMHAHQAFRNKIFLRLNLSLSDGISSLLCASRSTNLQTQFTPLVDLPARPQLNPSPSSLWCGSRSTNLHHLLSWSPKLSETRNSCMLATEFESLGENKLSSAWIKVNQPAPTLHSSSRCHQSFRNKMFFHACNWI